jgi:hypothetical protein
MTRGTSAQRLAPIRPLLLGIAVAHFVLLLVLRQWSLSGASMSAAGGQQEVERRERARGSGELLFFHPADLIVVEVPPPTGMDDGEKAGTEESSGADGKGAGAEEETSADSAPAGARVSRYITLFHGGRVGEGIVSGNEGGVSQAELDALDDFLQRVFMRCWEPPAGVSGRRLSARLRVLLDAGLQLGDYGLAASSGSELFDQSILRAAEGARDLLRQPGSVAGLGKIPAGLPSQFQKSGYECRIQFQTE